MKGNLFLGILRNPKSHKYLVIICPEVLGLFNVAVLFFVIYKLQKLN